VRGADPYSQRFADETVELGVRGCGFDRPTENPHHRATGAKLAPLLEGAEESVRRWRWIGT
jgi:hypothetical protein